MWAQEQFLFSVQIFSLWSKCILSCSIMADNFSRPSPTHITYLHTIVAHFTWPIALRIFLKFLDRNDSCEGSTILVSPFGMNFLQHHGMFKSSGFAKLYPNPSLLVSVSSWLSFWVSFGGCTTTMVNTCPFYLKTPRTVVRSTPSLPDIKFTIYPLWFNL